MSFALFLSAIKETALLDVAAHWNTARGNRLMPGWSDIDPVGLGRNLPIVWAWRYDAGLGIKPAVGDEIALGRTSEIVEFYPLTAGRGSARRPSLGTGARP